MLQASDTPPALLAGCRPDSDDESDNVSPRPRKAVPSWVQPAALLRTLTAQLAVDPDKIFGDRLRTCNLIEIFAGGGCPMPCT